MMKRKIVLLPEEVIQKIAAGEVVENGASVIKELIENAIDAGATRLLIETTNGGKTEIKVSDNGYGMSSEDLALSILRHATSKIKEEEDLFRLTTMGFRGEALYAIASVSKLTMISTVENEAVGNKLEVEGGKVMRLLPASRAQGTTVIVSSLFYNTPARRAFQKEDLVELQAIRKCLIHASLCYLECGFEWVDGGKTIFSFPHSATLEERVKMLLGEEMSTSCEKISEKGEEFSLFGLVGRCDYHRPNRRGQHLFINRRAVASPLIVEAIEEAFAFRLPEGRFPVFVLHLTLPPSLIDANVHPQKREVRLSEEKRLFAWVKEKVAASLDKRETPFFAFEEKSIAADSAPYLSPPPPLLEIESKEVEESPLSLTFSARFLFALNDLLIFEQEGALLLFHAKRALARILFEMKEESLSFSQSQKLLFPLIFEVGEEEEALLEAHLDLLKTMGIQLRLIGKRNFVLDSAPPCFDEKEKILSLISDLKLNEMEKKREALAIRLSKASSLTFTNEEAAKKLLHALFRCEVVDRTPSGKKISTLLTEETLLRLL